MSKYTTEVRFICEYEANRVSTTKLGDGFNSIDQIITIAAPHIFNFDFPIFDEEYRLVLEKKILRHFYGREICSETVGRWKLLLCDKLNVIMPFYNKLYRSELFEFNPLYDVDYSRNKIGSTSGTQQSVASENFANTTNENKSKTDSTIGTRSSVSDSNTESVTNSQNSENGTSSRNGTDRVTNDGTNWQLNSDTPQGGVQLMDNTDPNTVAGKAYLTTATKDTTENVKQENTTESSSDTKNAVGSGSRSDTGHGTNSENLSSENNAREVNEHNNTGENYKNVSGQISNSENYVERVAGKMGGKSYSEMLLEFRKTLLNIDRMILDDLEELFFGLW